METGVPKRSYVYGKTRKEVQEKLNKLLNEVRIGKYTDPAKMTVEEWFTIWINDYMVNYLRPTTWDSYNTQIEKHIIPTIGHIKLDKLRTFHLQKLYNDKLHGGRADGKKGGLAPKTVRYIHTVAHSALEQAVKERILEYNPAEAAIPPRKQRKEMKVFDTKQIKIFLKYAKETKYYAAYLLVLATGLRRGELLALRWEKDIDLKKRRLRVSRSLVRTNKGLIFQEPKTQLSRRVIDIPDSVIEELELHKLRQDRIKSLLGKAYSDHELVFCAEDGNPLQPRTLTRHFEKIIKQAGLPKIRFHDLRHTFVTSAIKVGIPLRSLQEIVGHYDPAYTMSAYSHVTKEMRKEATEKINNLISDCLEE